MKMHLRRHGAVGGWRDAKRRLVQKLALPGCCGTLTVTGDVLAKSANGASVRLGLSLDGTTMLTNIVSVAGKANQQMQTQCAIPTWMIPALRSTSA